MKRIFALLLAVVLILPLFSVVSLAETAEEYDNIWGYSYTVSDKKVTITGYKNENAVNLTIPTYLNGMAVTAIADCAFTFYEELETVSFSEDSKLQYIGDNAFALCTSLFSINIPDSVTRIGSGVFQHCAFESIALPRFVTEIGAYCFRNCYSLKGIVIGEKIIRIEESLLVGCSSLEYVTLPDRLLSIGDYAFNGCASLSAVRTASAPHINLPDGMTEIGSHAFYGCKSLGDFVIPSSVTEIGESAFENCGETVLYADEFSFAEKYASENRLSFVALKLPKIQLVGATKLTLKPEQGYVYSVNNLVWQAEGLFTDRKAGYNCTVFAVPEGKEGKAAFVRRITVRMSGQDEVEQNPDAEDLIKLRTGIATGSKNMAFDYNGDGNADVLDLVKLKRLLT